MPMFSYNALNTSGAEVRGQLHAEDMSTAALTIRDRGLRVLEIKQGRGAKGFLGQENFNDWLASQRSVSNASMMFFFRQMAFMLRAGLAVAQALELAQAQISSSRLNLVIRHLRKDIEAGQALSLAMKKHKAVFSDMAINLIVAGESTGDLDAIMERLAIHLEKRAALQAQTINAMIYPIVVVIAALGVGVFMVTKIIPKFADFLLAQGRALPTSTQTLIDISDYVRENGLSIIAVLIAVIVLTLVAYQTRVGRVQIDSFVLRIPIIGSALVTGAMSQMSWALSILLKSGVTVFDALKISSRLMGNKVYSNKLEQASIKIMGGAEMSASIQHPQIPVLVTQMIAVGENTGTLDSVLQELGEYYEKLLEISIKRLSAMIEPAMILVIGGMVGFVYYAFFQALFSLVAGG